MQRPIVLFAIATLVPVLLLLLGAFFGGLWAWVALLYMTVFTFAMDELVSYAAPLASEGSEFPAADQLSVGLGVAHFVLLFTAILALTGWGGVGWGSWLPLFLAFGMFFGQVSNSNAHELIHRSDKGLFRLGMWIYISLLFGHHTSAHRLVHHRFVATEDDPSTAEEGESFYEFAPRAWLGAFTAGREMESTRRAQAGKNGVHPYLIYIAGAIGFILLVSLLFGLPGMIVYLMLVIYAQMQLLLSDYVQHYGLMRAHTADGEVEPVSDKHSWNSGRWYSSALMLNAPRHSAHHAHPSWPYPELSLPPAGAAPLLPYSLPVMGAIALVPNQWFRVMDRRLAQWRAVTP
jgi:alkane 1-monooxygenase